MLVHVQVWSQAFDTDQHEEFRLEISHHAVFIHKLSKHLGINRQPKYAFSISASCEK